MRCPSAGFFADAVVAVARAVFHSSTRVRLLPTKGWLHSVTGNPNLTVWDDLAAQRVDITYPYFVLGTHRGQGTPVGVIDTLNLRLVFREQAQMIGITFSSLLLRPSGIWLLLALAAFLRLLIKHAGLRLPAVGRAYQQHRVAFHLTLGILLSLLSNFLCLLFASPPKYQPFIAGQDDFYAKIISGEARLMGEPPQLNPLLGS